MGILDRCDLEAVDFNDCDYYVGELLGLCDDITWECTGRSFAEWEIDQEAYVELGRAWLHFARLVWMRDPEWENLVRCLSDPNARFSVNEEYYLEDPDSAARHLVSDKLKVPLQVWGVLLRAAWAMLPTTSRQLTPSYL